MSGPSLEGVCKKFDRGVFHLDRFNEELRRVLGPEERAIPNEYKIESQSGLRQTIAWRLAPDALPKVEDSDLSVLMGDALINFRASLDHLAWIMVKRRGSFPGRSVKRRKREKIQQGIQFPLAKSSRTFPGVLERNLPGITLGTALGRLVARFQPYRRGDQAAAMRALRDLTNRDKHRLLLTAFWYSDKVKLAVNAKGWSILSQEPLISPSRPLKTGTPIMRATVTPISMNPSHVYLEGEFGSIDPALPGGWNARGVLNWVRDTTKVIIEETRPLL